jgi:phosphate transport system protein
MRRLFDEELADLDNSFTEMGMLVAQTIQKICPVICRS